MEEGAAEEALQQGTRGLEMEKFVWVRVGGSPSAHAILRTVTRRPPCIFKEPRSATGLEKRRPARLCAGLWNGFLAAASDRQTQPGALCTRPEDWPPAGLLSRLPWSPGLRHILTAGHASAQRAVVPGRLPGPGAPGGLEVLHSRVRGGSWRPRVWTPGSGRCEDMGVHLELCQHEGAFCSFSTTRKGNNNQHTLSA